MQQYDYLDLVELNMEISFNFVFLLTASLCMDRLLGGPEKQYLIHAFQIGYLPI